MILKIGQATVPIGTASSWLNGWALIGGPVLVVYEDLKVPAMMIRQGLTEEVALSTTRNMLTIAEQHGYVADAAEVWSRIKAAIPTANPSSVFTLVQPAPNDE